jgi:iron uptake system component EfeO
MLLALAGWGCGSDDAPTAQLKIGPYREYLVQSSADLLRAVQAMKPELEQGDVGRAQSRFARARVRYSQLEPAAEAFPALNLRIDGRFGEVPLSRLAGFHRIEKPLFGSETTVGTIAPTESLISDSKRLQQAIAEKRFSAQELASSSERILGEVSTVKLANQEQPYADADLVDISANLEAVGAALAALRPVLNDEERQDMQGLMNDAYSAIGEYGTPARDPDQPRDLSPGALFVVFDELSPAEIRELRKRVEPLRLAFADLRERLDEN